MKIPQEIFKDLRVYDTAQILALINESLKEVNGRSLPYNLMLSSKDKVSKPSDNKDLKKVCPKCKGKMEYYAKYDDGDWNYRCKGCSYSIKDKPTL